MDNRKTKNCPDCGKLIQAISARCAACAARVRWLDADRRRRTIENLKKANPPKPRPHCAECGVELVSPKSSICKTCACKRMAATRGPRQPHSEETKRKIKERAMARYNNPEYRAKWQKGIVARSQSEEWQAKQKEGSQKRNQSESYQKKLHDGLERRKTNPNWLASIKAIKGRRGPEHPSWKGTQTQRQLDYGRDEYKQWRDAVFARDNYTCQKCEVRGGSLHAHHIKGWSEFPELRYEVDNGLTLCVHCHSELHGHYIPGRLPKDRKGTAKPPHRKTTA